MARMVRARQWRRKNRAPGLPTLGDPDRVWSSDRRARSIGGVDAVDAPEVVVPAGRAQKAELLRRRWILEHTGQPYANNLFRAVRVEGRVDWDALEAAAHEVSQRHEALRTSFPAPWTQSRQLIRDSVSIPLRRVRLCDARSRVEMWRAAERVLRERVLRASDPSAPALASLDAIEIDTERSIIALTVDHLVADGVSIDMVAAELSRTYAAQRSGSATALAPPRQYRDFVAWEERERRRAVGASFWRQRLDGMGPMPRLSLPGLRAHALQADFRGGTFSVAVEPDLAARAQAFAQRRGVTPFVVWTSALVASIHATTGLRDVGMLVPVANRGFAGARLIVGWLANTIVLRVALPLRTRFDDVVSATWESLIDALQHQTAPWDDLVAAWEHENGEPDGVPPQLFVSADETIDARPPLRLDGCRTDEVRLEGATIAHAFDVRFLFTRGDVVVFVRYPLGLYDERAARDTAQQVLAACEALVSRPRDSVR
jgi:hypothetical protein